MVVLEENAAGCSSTSSAHFGDLIGEPSKGDDELSLPLLQLNPSERLLVTANGNLQRLVSSWNNRPVEVRVLRNVPRGGASATRTEFDREVELLLDGRVFCVARSVVTLSECRLVEAVGSGEVGLGQLFRHFGLLPRFSLRGCSRDAGSGSLERCYTLSATGIVCDIHERFLGPGPLETEPGSTTDVPLACSTGAAAAQHLGDLMASGLRSVAVVRGAFRPLERVLLSAAGNVQRLVSAWHGRSVVVRWSEHLGEDDNSEVLPRRWTRSATLAFEGDEDALTFCRARSCVEVFDGDLATAILEGGSPAGAAFELLGVLPRFELQSAGRRPCGGLWRRYVLWAEDCVAKSVSDSVRVRVTIEEEFETTVTTLNNGV